MEVSSTELMVTVESLGNREKMYVNIRQEIGEESDEIDTFAISVTRMRLFLKRHRLPRVCDSELFFYARIIKLSLF